MAGLPGDAMHTNRLSHIITMTAVLHGCRTPMTQNSISSVFTVSKNIVERNTYKEN